MSARGEVASRTLRHARHPVRWHRHRDAVRASSRARSDRLTARSLPRLSSSTVPSARTTVIASTQSRVLPYLKVAAPAALVATMPPAQAPVNVGTGGNHAPASASRVLHRRDRHAWLHGDAARLHVDDARHLRRREDHLAHGRCAARQRGLRADGKDRGGRIQSVDDIGGRAGKDNSRRVAAGEVGGVDEPVVSRQSSVVSHSPQSESPVISPSRQSSVVSPVVSPRLQSLVFSPAPVHGLCGRF